MNKIIIGLLSVILIGCLNNGEDTAGGTSDQGNAIVFGKVVDENGNGVAQAEVRLIPKNFQPYQMAGLPDSLLQVSSEGGGYVFPKVDTGSYNLEFTSGDNKKSFIKNIQITYDSLQVQDAVLYSTGTAIVYLADSLRNSGGFVFMEGTMLFKMVLPQGENYILLESLPAQKLPKIQFARNESIQQNYPLSTEVTISSMDTLFVGVFGTWSYSQTVRLNTSAQGAGLTEDLFNFPLLIRLEESNFIFSNAQENGGDLRFTKSDGVTVIPHEIEYWSHTEKRASIWVYLDTVYANHASQNFLMYWGRDSIVTTSRPADVFSPEGAFAAVWHLSEMGNSKVGGYIDATRNAFHGTGVSLSSGASVSGVIGKATDFDGMEDFIEFSGTASGLLNFPENGEYSISAWALPNVLDSLYHPILQKGDYQYGLKLHMNNSWEFAEYQDIVGWDLTVAEAVANEWTHLTAVRKGEFQALYINGVLADSTTEQIMADSLASIPRNSTFNINIGRNSEIKDRFWSGRLDEIRVSTTARSPDWVKLCFENQKIGSAIVSFIP